ncbi:hypothetical protein ACPTJO_29560, partial [Pseudomonas aeruginosa]
MSACACDGGQLRPLDEALAELLARAPRPPACESLALERALGRVLGEDLLAPMDLPHWDNSAMDGYALCSADLPRSGGSLTVGARIAAGDTRGMSPVSYKQLPAHVSRITIWVWGVWGVLGGG